MNRPGAVSFPLLYEAAAVNTKAARALKIKVLRDVLRDELAYEHKLRKEIRKAIKEFQQERRAEQYQAVITHLSQFKTLYIVALSALLGFVSLRMALN